MRRDLAGLGVLLTGASRGIGRCTAERLARAGCRLALTARSADDLEHVAQTVRALGAEVHTIRADLTAAADRERLVSEAVAKLGGLDVLVNNAGTCSFGEFATSSEDVLRTIMEINFFVPAELVRLCLPHLTRSARRPAVVNIASICGRRGIPSMSEHCASKFAVAGFTEAMRGELARFGIDAIMLVPGLVRTDDLDKHLLRNEGQIELNWSTAQPPERVARGVERALRNGWAETVVGWMALQVHRGQRILPWLIESIMQKKVRSFARKKL